MEEEDDMEDGDLEDLDGEGLNEPFFFLKSARSTGASFKKKGEAPRAGRRRTRVGASQPSPSSVLIV